MKTHLKSILLILITITLLTSIVSSVSATNTSGSISNYKFNDSNGNGTWDPTEHGIPNWKIKLTIPNGSNITATTNDSGFFMFSNLSAGNYKLEEVPQMGWVQTFPIKILGITYYNITLLAGDNWHDSGFGNMRIPQSTFNISGFKLNGTNNNRMGIENWNILLLNTNTGAETNATTNGMGFYSFSNLSNGTYNVTEKMRVGWTNVSPISQIVNISGKDIMGVNFTNALITPTPVTFNISGFKINGTDNNGMGIENWNIMLYNDTNGTQISSTMTDRTGFYNFTGLTNGTYNVTEGMMTGWTNTSTSPMSQIVTINPTFRTYP